MPFIRLREMGHEVEFFEWPIGKSMSPRILNYEVLILPRQTSDRVYQLAVSLKRERGTKIIYELDDNFRAVPPYNPASYNFGPGKPGSKIIEQYIQMSDGLICSTEHLASEYGKFNENVQVVANAVDEAQVERLAPKGITGRAKREGQIRIGWAGTNTHLGDLQLIARPIIKILRENPQARFIIIGFVATVMNDAQKRPVQITSRSLFPLDVQSQIEVIPPTDLERVPTLSDVGPRGECLGVTAYYDLISSSDLDIALAPLVRCSFNASKSWVKLLEYGMCGIPTIASAFGPYKQYQDEASESVVVHAWDEREWIQGLRLLISDESKRGELAGANLRNVREYHTMATRVDDWDAAVRALTTEAVAV